MFGDCLLPFAVGVERGGCGNAPPPCHGVGVVNAVVGGLGHCEAVLTGVVAHGRFTAVLGTGC